MCGEISYRATFRGEPIFGTPNSITMQYDEIHGIFTLFTEDPDLVGVHEYTVTGFFTNYPNSSTFGSDIQATATGQINIVSPCAGIDAIRTTQQDEQKFYNYGDTLIWDLVPFTVIPESSCPVTYSCTQLTGNPTFSLCDMQGTGIDTFFDDLTGTYMFWTTNKDLVPVGTYQLQFTGVVGDFSTSVNLFIIVQDSCTNPYIYLQSMNPFLDKTYVLGEEPILMPYLLSDLI